MGIEPTAQAWEAWVLPLYDAREGGYSIRIVGCDANWFYDFRKTSALRVIAMHLPVTVS